MNQVVAPDRRWLGVAAGIGTWTVASTVLLLVLSVAGAAITASVVSSMGTGNEPSSVGLDPAVEDAGWDTEGEWNDEDVAEAEAQPTPGSLLRLAVVLTITCSASSFLAGKVTVRVGGGVWIPGLVGVGLWVGAPFLLGLLVNPASYPGDILVAALVFTVVGLVFGVVVEDGQTSESVQDTQYKANRQEDVPPLMAVALGGAFGVFAGLIAFLAVMLVMPTAPSRVDDFGFSVAHGFDAREYEYLRTADAVMTGGFILAPSVGYFVAAFICTGLIRRLWPQGLCLIVGASLLLMAPLFTMFRPWMTSTDTLAWLAILLLCPPMLWLGSLLALRLRPPMFSTESNSATRPTQQAA